MTLDRRRRALLALGIAAPIAALAQQPGRPRRIGVLLGIPAPAGDIDPFYRGLASLGYVEGRDVVFERRSAEGRDARFAAAAAGLVALPVDVIVAAGSAAAKAARDATASIPIVMGTVDAVEQGLVESLAHPGRNVTGFTLLSAEAGRKQLALLKEAMPHIRRVAVLGNPQAPEYVRVVDAIRGSATAMGARLQAVEVREPDALDAAFAAMAHERAEAFIAMPDPVVMDGATTELAERARRARLPGLYPWRNYPYEGGLMSYGPKLGDLIALWPGYVDRILRGAKAGDLPVETPRKYELVLNERVARILGITFPDSLRLSADHIIN